MAQSKGPSGGSWGFTVGRKVALGFGLSFALLLLVASAGYRSIDALVANNARVPHTHTALECLATALSLLKDAETGQRGFVVTGDVAFLAPHEAAISALPANFAALRRLVADNPQQLARLGQLEAQVQAKLVELDRVIEERKDQASGTRPGPPPHRPREPPRQRLGVHGDPFQHLRSPKDFEGTGIGLATVRRIVVRHAGRVGAESAPGAGAKFWFTLG